MERTLTHHDTLVLQNVVQIGDLLLLPQPRLPNLSESLQLQRSSVIDVRSSEITRSQLWRDLIRMEDEYCDWRSREKGEPGWMRDVPLHVQTYLRHWYATVHLDVRYVCGIVPHTGLSYMIVDDGLTEEIERLFKLYRLQRINQLGFLQAPWIMMRDWPLVDRLTRMTRHYHSLDVMAIGLTIGRNLELGSADMATLQTALLTHDWGTVAGGDSVKLIDPKAFDEDLNYAELLRTKVNQRSWRKTCERRNIDERRLVRAVLNEGLLGEILDVADKLAYVARDIDTCLNVAVAMKAARFEDEEAYVGTRMLKEINEEHPYVCGVWDAVRRHEDRLVFTDVQRLVAFLKARIVLFRELYYHPRARFGEYLISRVLVKKLYDRGEVTRAELFEMDDHDLERLLERAYGKRAIVRALSTKSKVRSFATREEALAFKAEIETTVPFSLVEDHRNVVRPGTHFLVDTPNGVLPLWEAYPGDARELYEMATMLPSVHVYYIAESELLPDERQEILACMT